MRFTTCSRLPLLLSLSKQRMVRFRMSNNLTTPKNRLFSLLLLGFILYLITFVVLIGGRSWLVRYLHLPPAWYSGILVAVVISMCLLGWVIRSQANRQMKAAVSDRGFEFQKQIDPLQLNLYETSF